MSNRRFEMYVYRQALVRMRCQTAPKIDPQSASNFDPLELSVMASPRGRGGELIGFCV